MKRLRALCLILFLCFTALTTRAQEDDPAFTIKAKDDRGFVEIDTRTGISTVTNGVIITYSNVVLTADSATANSITGDILADGNVTIRTKGALWTGNRILYNFKTEQMESGKFKTGQAPFFLAGEDLHASRTNDGYTSTNAVVTTDDCADPAYKIQARSMTIVPGKYFVAHEATVRIGDVPIFYFPYYRRAIGSRVNHFDFLPGYRSAYGPYLLSTYKFYTKEKIDGAVRVDYREKRGFGGGPEFDWHLGSLGEGTVNYYYANDDNPNSSSSLAPIPEDRHRIAFSHQATVRTNLTVKVVANYQSDPNVDHDFFAKDYRDNIQPKSFLEVDQFWPNYSLNILAQPQVNDFQETVERLPDIKLTALRQQLGNTPFYYEGENTVGYYNRSFVDQSTNYSAGRADSFHQILLPQTFFGWLNVTPRVGGRFTYYTEAEGPGATTREETRGVFNTGSEVSFKSSRVWAGAENKLLDVKGLRHIFEPSINYVFVPRPNVQPPELPQFDPELASLRTLPIDFPQYNAIDAIDSQNVMRFGIRNRFQTKRDELVENLLNWSLTTDWRIDPRTNQTDFASLSSALEFRPRNWITFQSDTRYDLNRDRWLEAQHRLLLEPNNVWSLSLGHRYLDSEADPNSHIGNNLITTSLYYRLDENWGARISHHFEARDGTMEEQYYTIYRDLRSWTAALTFRVRDNRSAGNDYTIAATFSLKAFPRFGLGADRDKPELLVGY